jgi:hypothetical protein
VRTNPRRIVDLSATTSVVLLLTMALSTFAAPSALAGPMVAGHHAVRHHRAHASRVKLIQPVGAPFKAAFPSPPQADADDVTAAQHFPGAVSATAYWVSPDSADILNPGTPLPPAPTYLVAIGKFASHTAAAAFTASLRQTPGVRPAKIGRLRGDQFLGREGSAINHARGVTQPHAWDSEVALTRGSTVYLSIAYTTNRAAATSFTHSVRPAAVVGNGLPVVPTPSSGGGSSGLDRLIGEGALAMIVVAGLLILVSKARSGSSGGSTSKTKRQRAGKHGGGPGAASGAASSVAQFGWLHQQPAMPGQLAHPQLGEEPPASAGSGVAIDPYAPLAMTRTAAPSAPPVVAEFRPEATQTADPDQFEALAAGEPVASMAGSIDVLPR